MAERGEERLYRVEAVVLKRVKIGEADRILTIYTPQYGKIRVVAKGVRRTTSRLAGNLELFTQTKMMLASGRNLDIITQSEPLNYFPNLRPTPDSNLALHAFYMVDLLERLSGEDIQNVPAYELLVEALAALDRGDDPDTLTRAYELKLLDFMGYRPQLTNCARCNTPLEPVKNYFSPEQGGVLCPACGESARANLPISVDALKILRYLQKNPFAAGPRLRLSDELRQELEKILASYRRYHLERDLKSAEFIHTLSQ